MEDVVVQLASITATSSFGLTQPQAKGEYGLIGQTSAGQSTLIELIANNHTEVKARLHFGSRTPKMDYCPPTCGFCH